MPSVVLPTDPPELIFQWERRTRAHWRLAGIIACSLLAHAASFYVLQVSYTPTGSELPPPAQVFMAPLDDANGPAFSRWLAMTDPALTVQPVPPSPEETLAGLDFHYVPSYVAARPGFKPLDPLPEESSAANPPRPRPPGPVPMPRTPSRTVSPGQTSVASPAKVPTKVLLSNDILSRLAAALPPVTYTTAADGKKLLEPTSFLVGIRPEGGTPFLFLRSKPDNPPAEEYARAYLARLNFQPEPSTTETRWGTADFAWGTEIYR